MTLDVIKTLISSIQEFAFVLQGGGHGCKVKSATSQEVYTVTVNLHYHPIKCTCKDWTFRKSKMGQMCGHMIAVMLFYKPDLASLTDDIKNPILTIRREGCGWTQVRWSQLSRDEADAMERARYNDLYDPNYIDQPIYA